MTHLNDPLATGILTIDLAVVAQNYQKIRAYCQSLDEKAVVAAVVKANGYGLGIVEVSQALYGAGCRLFYVATPDEGLLLRTTFADTEIFILNGLFLGQEAIYAENKLIPCLATDAQINAWANLGDLPCVVHFNSGINRLGMELDDFLAMPAAVTDKLNIRHVMSHFASADWPEDLQNTYQISRLQQISTALPDTSISFSNSAAVALKELQSLDAESVNILRPGLALWGAKPFAEYPIDIKPVMSLNVRVLQVTDIQQGDQVGYSHLFTAAKPMKTAIVAAGYADGLFRNLSSVDGNNGYFYFMGCKLPILGMVSMDSVVLDVSAVPDGQLNEGDFVEVIGENISLDMLAEWSNTINYEILTSLGNRFVRKYINGES